MNKQFEQDKVGNGSDAVVEKASGHRRWRRAARMAAGMLLACLMPATAVAADLLLNITDSGFDPVPIGATVVYEVTVENSDIDDVSNGIAVFDLPVGATFKKSSASYCSADTASPVRVTCVLPVLELDKPEKFSIEIGTSGISGTSTQTVNLYGAIGFADNLSSVTGLIKDMDPQGAGAGSLFYAGDANLSNNWRTEGTTLERSTDLVLVKQGPATIIGGGVATYTIEVTNAGPSPSAGFAVSDTLSGPTYVAGSFQGGGLWSFDEANHIATYTGPALAVGQSALFTLKAKVDAATGTVENTARVEPSTDPLQPRESDPSNNTHTVSTIVTPGADLRISKNLKASPAVAGDTATFQINITNPGPSPAVNPSWEDKLPEGFSLTGTVPVVPGWSCSFLDSNTRIKCTYTGNLAVGASVDFEFDATVPSSGTNSSGDVTNTASVTSQTDDPDTSNNSFAAKFPVMANGADLGLTKKKDPKLVSIWPGAGDDSDSRMTSTINVLNYGPRSATDKVQVVDKLADGEEYISGGNTGEWVCSVSPTPWTAGTLQVVTCDLDASRYPLAKGAATPTLEIITRARAANLNMENEACTGGSGGSLSPGTSADDAVNKYGDKNPANNCAHDGTRTTLDRVDLEITKTTQTGNGTERHLLDVNDDELTYTLRVTNKDLGPGSANATGIVVSDIIPGYVAAGEVAGLPLAATGVSVQTTSGWDCSGSNGASIICRSGVNGLAPGEVEDVTITVRRPLFDSVLQTIGSAGCGVGAPSKGAYCNTAGVAIDPAVTTSVGEINTLNNRASDWVKIERQANMRTVSKTVSNSQPGTPNQGIGQIGVNSEYKITYFNDGPSVVPGVKFRDVLTLPANDAGFVLVSATRTPGAVQCSVDSLPGGIQSVANAGGGTSYQNTTGAALDLGISCPAMTMAYRQNEVMTVVIRPNRDAAGVTGRIFENTGEFEIAGGAIGSDVDGSYNYNINNSAADDKKSAELTFDTEVAKLVINKTDIKTGSEADFGGVDPLGFDDNDPSKNLLTYRISVENLGPSVATDVTLADTLRVPLGKRVQLLGVAGGTIASPPAAGAYSLSGCTVKSANPFTGTGTALTDAGLQIECKMPGAGFSSNAVGVLNTRSTTYLFVRYQYLDAPSGTGDTLKNYASATSLESTPVEYVEDTTVRTRADLAVVKTVYTDLPDAAPDQALPVPATEVTLWQPFYWVMDAQNLGPGASLSKVRGANDQLSGTGTVITDKLPAGTEVLGNVTWVKKGPAQTDTTPNGSGQCVVSSSLEITCNVGDVTKDGKVRVIAKVRHTAWPSGGKVSNIATVKTEQVDPVPGNNKDDEEIKFVRASLAGVVYEDRLRSAGQGGNRQSATAEPGIEKVTVRLSGTDAYGNRLSSTVAGAPVDYIEVKTDGNGSYKFDNLGPSDASGYTVTQVQPAGFIDSPDTVPVLPAAGAASLGGTYNGSVLYSGVVVLGNSVGVNYDFPEVRRPSLSGVVYFDADRNDTYGGSDTVIDGATVELLDANNQQLIDSVTTAGGVYKFANLDPLKTYTLREPLPVGYANRPNAVNKGKIGGVLCATGCTPGNNVGNEGADISRISSIDLSSGQDGTEFNFGEDATTPLSGKVYLDRNDNNVADSTEPGIKNVSVTLYLKKPDGNYEQVGESFTTGTSGDYLFTGLVVGESYRVIETQPTGLADNTAEQAKSDVNIIDVAGLSAAGSSGHNFGEVPATISGRVYLDSNNRNGYEAGEPGLGQVKLKLTYADGGAVLDALGNSVGEITTANDGTYSFPDLLAGEYTVTEPEQPSYVDGATAIATLNGATIAGTVTSGTQGAGTTPKQLPSAISSIHLNAGAKSPDNNFGEILPVSVSGRVFFDLNNNGAQDLPGDQGIGGVDIVLTGINDLNESVTAIIKGSAADGSFAFEGLRPGTYTLVEKDQPVGTAQGITTAGKLTSTNAASGVASNGASPESSKIAGINLLMPGDASTENLFGEIPTNSGITGKVWLDANNDGVIDPTESGIAGVELLLTGVDINNAPIAPISFTTLTDGEYAFLNLPPGTYKVVEKNQAVGTLDGKTKIGNIGGTPMGTQGQPDGTATVSNPSNIAVIKVGVGEFSVQNNFGEIPAGLISGFVYNDGNDDGIKDSDEGGYAGISVTLTGTDDMGNPVNTTVTTKPDGSYSFPDLRPGTYVVTEGTPPPETLNGKTTAGTVGGGVGSNPTPTTSVITGIVLTPGTQSVDNNFGEIGDSPDMLVSKSSTTVKFTVNNVATYIIRVRNGGQKPSFGEYIVKDRLPAGLSLAEVPAGNGWTCSGAVGDARFECRSSEVVNAGATSLSDITVKANVSAEAAKAGTVNNAVLIEGGGENEFRTPTTTERNTFEGDVSTLPVCDTAISQNFCRVPNQVQLSSSVGGTVWFDIGGDDTLLDGGDERLHSWIVELVDSITGAVSKSTVTAADGSYRFGDVIPGQKWNLQFRDPVSGVLWAWPVNKETAGGMGVSCDADKAISGSTASACRISENGSSQLQVVLEAGVHMPQQSLPVDPSGVVYDAVTRDPVPGSIVTLSPVGVCNGYDPKTAVLNSMAGGYRIEGNAISMTVGNSGYYQFMFGPAAPARCEFRLTVTPPGGYQFVSSMIPAQDGSLSPAGAAGTSHLVQPQANAPTGAVGTPTQYWLTLFAGSATAGIVHNHIPLDTAEATGLVITKTGDRQTAEIGDTVQYTITVRQTAGSALATVNIVDTLPRGFTYIDGTGRVGGRAVDNPLGKPGPRLGFDLGPIDVGGQLVLTYRVRVGVGAQQGDGVNRAQAHGCSINGGCIDPVGLTPVPGSIPSNRAEYRVRVTGGVFTEEACVLGKIFVDCNNNHVQDREELGIPGVRMYFSNGTWMISDSEGKYSYCGLTPQSHTLKVDPSTLPVGARLTTSSNRNLGDADSLFLDLKNGELHRADFVEGSCSNPLLEQVKARRTQGEVRAPETETGQSQLRFDSKPARAPQQATDSSKQGPIVQPRPNPPSAAAQQEVQP